MNPSVSRFILSMSGALFMFALAFMLVLMSGCASTSRMDAVTRTRGVQFGQPVDLVATTHQQTDGTIGVDPQVVESGMGLVSQLTTGGALGVATGIAALWLRERKLHADTKASDDTAWNKLADRQTPLQVAGA